MGAVQVVTCVRMVKFICFEVDHLKFSAMVVTMAFNTLLCPDLCRSMISLLFIDSRCNFLMAIQTLFIGNFFTQDMALCAI